MPTTTIERRGFLGIDTRRDKTQVGEHHLVRALNCVLDEGSIRSMKGDELWGSLNANALAGTYRSLFAVDVGNTEWLLLHKGGLLYAGTEGGSWAIIGAVQGGNLAVQDAESAWELRGHTVGSSGLPVHRVLFKQSSGCKTIEFNGTTWLGMNAGINNTAAFNLSLVAGGVNQPVGTFRVRMVAQRRANGVLTAESAPTGLNSSNSVDLGYQEITITAPTQRILVTLTDPSPDPQITDYAAQVTKELEFAAGTEFTNNGNDPTLYFEAQHIARAAFPLGLYLDTSALSLTVPDLLGFKPISGHLTSVTTGEIVFFALEYSPETPYQSRIYNTAIEGGPYHRELYNPNEFIDAATSDGKLLTYLGICGDHLVIGKETKTGILPSRDPTAKVVWVDERVGIPHRKCAANISEAELVALCHDGLVRRFAGSRWDRYEDAPYSKLIALESKKINPTSVDWAWVDERLHLIFVDSTTSERRAWVLHTNQAWGWTEWGNLRHAFNVVVSNGAAWVFLSTTDGRLYRQNPVGEVYTHASRGGVRVSGQIVPAMLRPAKSRNTIELWRGGVEGEFERLMSAYYRGNQGEMSPALQYGTPDPELPINQHVNWFQINPAEAVWGNNIEMGLNFEGETLVRGFDFEVVEQDGGGLGWSSSPDTPPYNYLPGWATNALLDLRFDQDSASVLDYSGRRRHFVWDPAASGLRSHLPAMVPGGGHEVTSALGSGYKCPTWDGLDNFNAGLLVTPMTLEIECGFDSLAASAVLIEAGNGTDFWRWQVNGNGSIEFQVHTSVLNFRYQTAPGVVVASTTEDFFIQFVLSNGGYNGQVYCGPRIGPTLPITTLRSML